MALVVVITIKILKVRVNAKKKKEKFMAYIWSIHVILSGSNHLTAILYLLLLTLVCFDGSARMIDEE